MHVLLLAPALATNAQIPHGDKNGSNSDVLNSMLRVLDREIDAYIATGKVKPTEYKVPRLKMPWAFTIFDIGQLVETQLPKLKEYNHTP